ncbi:hypothetical protein, partial [Bacillus massiliigorillae]|uniref:hypothetical protein n=1 Tax=Bacillus massiliigorillae TaxID=1243664 RepID=UPI0005AAA5F7
VRRAVLENPLLVFKTDWLTTEHGRCKVRQRKTVTGSFDCCIYFLFDFKAKRRHVADVRLEKEKRMFKSFLSNIL